MKARSTKGGFEKIQESQCELSTAYREIKYVMDSVSARSVCCEIEVHC